MKLIVGLGNPGKRYQTTRHNLGFMVLDKMLGANGWRKSSKAQAILKSKNQTLFVKPQTFMNDSGISVAYLARTKKIKPCDILIVRDDIDLEFGLIRARRKSTSSGHKGIKSVLSALKVKQISQIKIGIGQDKTVDLNDYVISKFSSDEKKILPKILDHSVNLVLKFISSLPAARLPARQGEAGKFENTSINVGGS